MEVKRAENTVFTEIQRREATRSEGVDYDFYADSNGTNITDDMKFSRNQSNVQVLNQQRSVR